MRRALGELAIEGVETSRLLHLSLLDEPGFSAGGFDIHHLERLMAGGFGRS
jgi:acetyl-CoA carboxylase biotin carboxylase subunit